MTAMTPMGGRAVLVVISWPHGVGLGNIMAGQAFGLGFRRQCFTSHRMTEILLRREQKDMRASRLVRAKVWSRERQGLQETGRSLTVEQSSEGERVMEASLEKYIGTRS